MSNPLSTSKVKSSRRTSQTPPNQKQLAGDQDDMHVDGEYLVVRLLTSTALEGAFRVHILPESLEKAGLWVGDLCSISSEDGAAGYGIAWRADDGMGSRPKHKPAKMTQTIRNAFGFQEGSRVTVKKADIKIHPARKIILSDVTPLDYNRPVAKDDDCWRSRVIGLLANCEALATGISFEVTAKKKDRRRFCIESVETNEPHAPDAPTLFRFNDSTQLVFPDIIESDLSSYNAGSSNETTRQIRNGASAPTRLTQQFGLNTNSFGGLMEQCNKLNSQLQDLLDTSSDLLQMTEFCYNPAVLLHGYEGTGKTTLLNALAESGFGSKVHRLQRATLTGGSVARNQAIIEEVFDKAEAAQPSLILIDNLHDLAPVDDITYSEILFLRIQRLQNRQGNRVMIVAATRSPNDIKSTLISGDCFSYSIELPIPDLVAREQILNFARHKSPFAKDPLSTEIAARTQGFTARDITLLHKRAAIYGRHRYKAECEQAEMAHSPQPPTYEEVVVNMNGASSPSPPQVTLPRATLTIQDFELALKEVRPTALREVFTEKPRIRWSDIGGSAQIKDTFDEIIGWPLLYKDVISKMEYQPPKGVLLYGPPGCSKTLTAQAVANTYNFNFIAIKGAELISMYVGESERQVREIFRKAKTAAPCVIFFDEIDSIATERDSAGTKGLNVLTTLLTEMDGFEPLKDVFVLAATNKPEVLDPALMRPGRFDSHVYVGPPNESARAEIVTIATRAVSLFGNVDLKKLVLNTAGYSGAEIVRLCHSAKASAIRRCIPGLSVDVSITHEDFQMALQATKKGITKEMLEAYEAFGKSQDIS